MTDSTETLKIENTTHTLNPKADMFAVDEYFDETSKERLPVMLSVQTVDNCGCTLSGQTEEAFYVIACMKEWCDIHFFYYVSSHDSETTHIHQHWCDLKHDGAVYGWRHAEKSEATGSTPSSVGAKILSA